MEATAVAVPVTRLQFRVAWLCGVVLLLEGYDLASVGYAVPSLVDAWRIPPSALTQAITAGNIGLMIGSLCAGLLGDRLGRKLVLLGCVIAFGFFSLLSAFAQSPSQLGVLRFFTGLGLGGALPIAVALTSDFAPRASNGQLVIVMLTAVPIGFTVGGLLASWLVSLFGWPAIFVAGGLLPLAAVPLLALLLPDSLALLTSRRSATLVATLFQSGLASRTLLLWMINTLSYLGIYFILSWMPAILHGAGLSSSKAILGTTVYGVGVIATPLLTALAIEHFELEPVLTVGLAFGAVCALTIGMLDPSFGPLSLLLCGVGIAGGCQAGINTLSAMAYPAQIRSTGTGWALGVGRVGTIAGPLVGGLLFGWGFQARKMFMAATIPAIATAVLVLVLGQRRNPSRRQKVENIADR